MLVECRTIDVYSTSMWKENLVLKESMGCLAREADM